MPYRGQLIDEVCNHCHEKAVMRCQRCGAPLCTEHTPRPLRRCDPCEEGYRVGKSRAVACLAGPP